MSKFGDIGFLAVEIVKWKRKGLKRHRRRWPHVVQMSSLKPFKTASGHWVDEGSSIREYLGHALPLNFSTKPDLFVHQLSTLE